MGFFEPQPPRQPAFLPPINVRSSGRPPRDNTDKSTRRDPVHWEASARPRQTPQSSQQNAVQQPLVSQGSSQRRPAALQATVQSAPSQLPSTIDLTANSEPQQPQQPRRRGRPPGSKNKKTATATTRSGRVLKETSKKKTSKFDNMTRAELIALLRQQGAEQDAQLNRTDEEKE